jgi:hypothetical protein
MDNIIKKVEIIEGLLADIEKEVPNKLIFDKTKKNLWESYNYIEYDLNHNANICFTHNEDGETYSFCSIHIHFVCFVNNGVHSVLLKMLKRNQRKKNLFFFNFTNFLNH